MTRMALSLCCLLLVGLGPTVQSAVAAQDCTNERLEALTGEMLEVMNEHPNAVDHLEEETARIEQEYGGEPSDAEACEAFEKLIEALAQY